jgi:signal transduction histidine kinase
VVCEATTNVLKHSGAERAWVTIADLGDGGLQVTVVDDGRGFVAADGGTGLRGLVDRVEVVGGSLTVASGDGRGTTLTARFPVRELTDA